MGNTLDKQEMINKFAETVGMEKAADLIEEACRIAGVADKPCYSKTETLSLLQVLRQRGGMLGIIAGFMAAEAHLMDE